jgi:hypothetical protein
MGHDRLLTAAGLAGLAFGLGVVTAARLGAELEQMMSGYGVMVMLAAAYLLVGLTLRRLVARRSRVSRGRVPVAAEPRA